MSKLDDIRVLEEYDKKSEKKTDCLICTKKKEWFDRAKSSISLSIPAAAARHWAAHLCIAMHGTTLQVSSENPKIFMHSPFMHH